MSLRDLLPGFGGEQQDTDSCGWSDAPRGDDGALLCPRCEHADYEIHEEWAVPGVVERHLYCVNCGFFELLPDGVEICEGGDGDE